jgi:DNA replication ATP-dependent helicase Dna2
VATIDRYQGRDKAVMLLSLVRSNPAGNAGQLLADWQRLNVALTRARVKLLVVGSARTLAGVPLLARLVGMAREGGWLVQLPPEATAVGAGAAGAAAAAAPLPMVVGD